MSKKRNKTIVYVIAIAIIIVAFLLLGGGEWMKGMTHGNRSANLADLKWLQIMISLGIGFLIGLLASKRRWL